MEKNILWLALALVLFVVAMFVKDAHAERLDMNFTSTVINTKGTNIPACLVQRGAASMVIPAPCAAVAEQVRKMVCNIGPDIDDQSCGLTILAFTIDGERRGLM